MVKRDLLGLTEVFHAQTVHRKSVAYVSGAVMTQALGHHILLECAFMVV